MERDFGYVDRGGTGRGTYWDVEPVGAILTIVISMLRADCAGTRPGSGI
jgi:hypothetical protein